MLDRPAGYSKVSLVDWLDDAYQKAPAAYTVWLCAGGDLIYLLDDCTLKACAAH